MSTPERRMPKRPSLPPLFFAALCAWAAVFITEDALWKAHLQQALPYAGIAITAGTLVASFAVAICLARANTKLSPYAQASKNGMLVSCIAFATTCLCACLFWSVWEADTSSLVALCKSNQGMELELTGDPSQKDYGYVSVARTRVNGHFASLRLIWPNDAEPLAAGHKILAQGSILEIKADESGQWLHQNGYAGTLRATSFEECGYAPSLQGIVAPLRDASSKRIEALGGDAAALLCGITLGNRTLYADTELEQAFQTTGLAHLMAVSGTHLGVVTALLVALLTRTKLKRAARGCILIAVLASYVALTACSASALRACTMCAVALIVGLLSRRKSIISALALCIFVFLGISPPIAFLLGFQLSSLSVLGLALFVPLFNAWTSWFCAQRLAALSPSFAATLAATFLTLPATIPVFSQLPLISPLANMAAAPFVTAALCLGIIGVVIACLLPPIGDLLLHAAGALAACCAAIVRLLADIPGACIPLSSEGTGIAVAFAIAIVLLWAAWPLPNPAQPNTQKRGLSFALGCLILIAPLFLALSSGFGQNAGTDATSSRVIMLDVGQGDSMLIQSKGSCVLVDTGQDGALLLRRLAEQGITHLDAIIITHKDADHAGALSELSGVIRVEHVYVHADLLDKDFEQSVLEAARWVMNGREAEGLHLGAQIGVGDFKLKLLSPAEGGESGNADSLVNLLEYDDKNDGCIEFRGLLTGDAEQDAIANIADKLGRVDFLKVAHHGSKNGLTDEEARALSPQVALISVGADNTYGHPSTKTLRQLEGVGARIYRTDKQGSITLEFSASSMNVRCSA